MKYLFNYTKTMSPIPIIIFTRKLIYKNIGDVVKYKSQPSLFD